MILTLILGPMGSGKSNFLLEIIKGKVIAGEEFLAITHKGNTRDEGISSRSGISLEAQKTDNLEILYYDSAHKTILIDEIHFFDTRAYDQINFAKICNTDFRQIVVCGLENDYKGNEFPIITKLKKIADNIIRLKGDCEWCGKKKSTVKNIIIKNNKMLKRGVPSVLADDGKLKYCSVCKDCFDHLAGVA